MNPLWTRQIKAMLGLELRKSLFTGRAVPAYLLAMVPVGIGLLWAIVAMLTQPDDLPQIQSASFIFAGIYQFILRGFLFMGCVWTFMNLFRGEVLDRSLHYYFLAPIRREVLVAGKFVAGVLSTSILFTACTLISTVLFYSAFGFSDASEYLLSGPGFGHTLAYVGVTLLACLGYGAVFMFIGLFFKNPIIPAAAIFLWEAVNPFLPALLKKISVIFYLSSLLPVDLPDDVFAIIAEPVPLWLAIPGFFLFTAVMLFVAGLKIRKMEIAYASE